VEETNSVPPPLEDLLLKKKIRELEHKCDEYHVLIDTLQTNLRSAVARIPEEKRGEITEVQSYKWCSTWKRAE